MVCARTVLTYGTVLWAAMATVTARPEAPAPLEKQPLAPVLDPGKQPGPGPAPALPSPAPQPAPKPAPDQLEADAHFECLQPGQFDPKKDYFPYKLRLSSKEGFEVDYFKHFKVVTNKLEEETYVLVQCGAPEPQFDDNYMPELAGVTKFFEIPPKRYATLQNSTLAFLEELEVSPPMIVPGSSSAPYRDGRDMENKPNKALNKYVGINYSLTPRQYEEVDLVFAGNPNPLEKYVTPSEGNELTPLARMEWMGFYSLFFNKEKIAQDKTQGIRDNYLCMKNKLQELKQEKNAKMYKIAWARYEQPNVNNNNKPTWVLSAKEFKEGFTEDILGEVAHGAIDSNFTNLDAMKAALTEVDVLIDESYGVRTLEGSLRKYGLEDTPAEAMNYKFIKNRMVLRTDGLRTENDGNDWYQSGMVHADVVLQDLIRALYMRQSHSMERYWIRNIASDEHFQFIINDNNTMAHQVSEVKAIGCEEIDWDNVNLRMRKDESSATLLHTSVTAITAVLAVMAGHYYL